MKNLYLKKISTQGFPTIPFSTLDVNIVLWTAFAWQKMVHYFIISCLAQKPTLSLILLPLQHSATIHSNPILQNIRDSPNYFSSTRNLI